MYQKNTYDFLEDLAKSESSGNYLAKNTKGYLGKYQMGEEALVDAGYYYRRPEGEKYTNKWDNGFTGVDDIYSEEDFLNDPIAQENAVRAYQHAVWGYIKNEAEKNDGKIINGIKMTKSGMLAGAHLVGHADLKRYLKSNGTYIPRDANLVSVEKYIKNYAGYDISEIINYKPPKQEPLDPIEQALINQILITFEGIYSRREITKLVRNTISKTAAENLMNKSKEITSNQEQNLTPPRKKNYSSSSSSDGKWVTINGNHILIEK